MDEDGIEIDRAILRALLKGLKKTFVFSASMFGFIDQVYSVKMAGYRRIYGLKRITCDNH